MNRGRKTRNPYSWQIARLRAFIHTEKEECRFYEMCYEKTGRQFPYKVLSVVVFFLNEQYVKKPGSLVTLYREAYTGDGPCGDFEKRYEKYYHALRERGFL
jgi:hypothetical protein